MAEEELEELVGRRLPEGHRRLLSSRVLKLGTKHVGKQRKDKEKWKEAQVEGWMLARERSMS
eukprot:11223654-Lingulodinium_polyedra.AAC.1